MIPVVPVVLSEGNIAVPSCYY